MSTKRNKLFFLLKSTIQLLGLVFVLMFFLACTDIPYNALMRLAEVPSCERPPRYIFVQGGNAFPSADALLLQYHLTLQVNHILELVWFLSLTLVLCNLK